MPKFQLSFRKFSKKTSNRIWIVIDVQKRKKKGSIANQDIIVIGIFSTFVPRVRNVREDDRDISVIRICRLIDAPY